MSLLLDIVGRVANFYGVLGQKKTLRFVVRTAQAAQY